MTTVLSNARLVLTDQIVEGSLSLDGGTIQSIDSGPTAVSGADLEGDFLIPGLVELRTDNLEKHYEPRKKV